MAPMWDRIDPLAEKYYGISPYAYCGSDPVNFGDYDGMDYWHTSDPNAIRKFLQYGTMGGDKWDYATSAEFDDNLFYNTDTGSYYYSFGTVVNGEITCIGTELPGSLLGDNTADYTDIFEPLYPTSSSDGASSSVGKAIGYSFIGAGEIASRSGEIGSRVKKLKVDLSMMTAVRRFPYAGHTISAIYFCSNAGYTFSTGESYPDVIYKKCGEISWKSKN